MITIAMAANLPAYATPRTEIQATIEALLKRQQAPKNSAITDAYTHSDILSRIYVRGAYAAIWTDREQIESLLRSISEAYDDGLRPEDYHLDLLRKLISREALSVAELAERDLLLTDAFARLAYNLRFGKANPLDIDANWNYSRALITDDPANWLRQAIVDDEIATALTWLRPKIPSYQILKSALREYRKIAAAGGFPSISTGPTLKPGTRDPRIGALRARLSVTGISPESEISNEYFDSGLEQRIRKFQRQYGLLEDGLVGAATLAALNQTSQSHIDALRINLERLRWLFRDIEENFITVNIAAFQATYIRKGSIRWTARAIVGRPYRKTESFKATMTHIIFNPTWTVPPTILRDDILPAMRKDPSYLSRKGLRVLARSGSSIDTSTIDWQGASARGFPYQIRQDPGPKNALGRVKFIFPNPHLIYLHDTPSSELFDRAERTFSSGCIRIERPLALAELLLKANAEATPVDIEKILASNVPTRVDLKRALTVMIVYLTAFGHVDGTIHFRRDIYHRDRAVLQALDGPFQFAPPSGYPSARADAHAVKRWVTAEHAADVSKQ